MLKRLTTSIDNGTYTPPTGTDKYAREFLEALAMSDSIQAKGLVDLSVTPEEHQKAWRSQKSGTASEPTTLGFGHFKTATFDPTLNEIDCLLRSLPLEFGFVPLLGYRLLI